MGLVHAYKKGEVPASKVSKAVKDAAKSMKKSSTKKYASTKHTDLPDKVKEERDYKEEYKKYSSSTKSKKYRAELNQYNRKKGTYGNGDGKDASHKGGKIVGFESQSKNRGRAEKSRLKKEAVNEDGHTDVASAERKLKLIVKDAMDTINALRGMSNEDSLPSWWTDKITLAKDYVSKSRDYITNPAESVNEGKFNPNKIKIHTNKAIGYLKQAQKFAKEGQKGAVWQRIGDARDELKMTDKFLESVNEIFPKGAGRKISKAMQKGRKWSMHVDGKKIKTYTSKRAAVIAHNKFMKDTDNWKEVSIQAESVNEKTVSIGGEELLKFLMKRFKMSKSQAIASMKKHKMDMSFLKKESVNESIQLPHGMELGKVFTGHGKSFVKEAVEPAGNMAKIQKIVKDSQATKLGGVMIDMQSASLLMKLFNAVSDKDKEKMNTFPAKKLTLVIKNLWSRVKLKLPL